MNKTDVKNMKAIIKYRDVVAKGPTFTKGGDYQQDYINHLETKELKELIETFENKAKQGAITKLKKVVDEMFAKYGEEGDNMIAVYAANCPERQVYDADPMDDISWGGFDDKYNQLYFPICAAWDCAGYWARQDKTKEELAEWDAKWDEYDNDLEKLRNVLSELKIADAEEYWKDDNGALNEMWYGVIGVMKDYRVVAFVIRDDGMLCDEDGYETFHNSIVAKF